MSCMFAHYCCPLKFLLFSSDDPKKLELFVALKFEWKNLLNLTNEVNSAPWFSCTCTKIAWEHQKGFFFQCFIDFINAWIKKIKTKKVP